MVESTGVHMHGIVCPQCEHKFYTKLPDVEENLESGKVIELGCVECESKIRKVYEFTEREDHVDMDCEVEVIGGDGDE
jgi:hypothetical protein